MKKVFSTSKLRLISQSFFIFLASVLLLLCGYLLRAENLGIWSFPLIVLGVATLLLVGGMVVVFIREQIRYDHFQQEFLTIALHKFRTPLTGIKWAAKSLLKPMTSTELTYISQEINNAGERLIEIVEILSHIEGIENTRTNKFEAVSVREIVEKSAAKYSQKIEEKNLTFAIEIPSTLPLVILDKLKIEFVLEILIENAITYTPKDGRIGIAAIRKGDFIEIMVSDSGIGIVPRERRQLFRQFYRGDKAKTTDTEGMGLGLYIAKRIVLQNHGTISVRSAGRDKGAMFTVRFRV